MTYKVARLKVSRCLTIRKTFYTFTKEGYRDTEKYVLGAEPPRHTGTTKNLIFNKNKFDRLDSVYNLELEIKVGRGTEKNNDIGLDKHIPTATATSTTPACNRSTTTDADAT